jgi:hypothetical protein
MSGGGTQRFVTGRGAILALAALVAGLFLLLLPGTAVAETLEGTDEDAAPEAASVVQEEFASESVEAEELPLAEETTDEQLVTEPSTAPSGEPEPEIADLPADPALAEEAVSDAEDGQPNPVGDAPIATSGDLEDPEPTDEPVPGIWILQAPGGAVSLEFTSEGTVRFGDEERPLELITGIVIIGTDGDDDLTVIYAGSPPGIPIEFDGGGGANTLRGPAVHATWNVTESDGGTIELITFAAVQTIVGAADTDDTFVIGPVGWVSGSLDGGEGGWDVLVIEGSYGSLESTASGPHAGTLVLDGRPLHYAGLEPITLVSPVPTVVVNGSSSDDVLQLLVDPSLPTYLMVRNKAGSTSTIESVSFLASAVTSLTIRGLDGYDEVEIASNITLRNASLTIEAEVIRVNGFKVDTGAGAITLTAEHVGGNADAQVELTGAELRGGTIEATATATVRNVPSSLPFISVLSTASAKVIVTNTTIDATGSVTLRSKVDVDLRANAQGLPVPLPGDAAFGLLDINTTSTTQLLGTTTVDARGELLIEAITTIAGEAGGDATGSSIGAGVAIGLIDQTTTAAILSTGTIDATKVTVYAGSSNDMAVTSLASGGGGESDDEGSPVGSDASTLTGGEAATADGGVGVAGAISFGKLLGRTLAYILGGDTHGLVITVGAGQDVTVNATSSNRLLVVADASSVADTEVGVGVAVAVTIVDVLTDAYVGGDVAIVAGRLLVQALAPVAGTDLELPETATYLAEATSGPGNAANVGVAGALAVTVVKQVTRARLLEGSTLDASHATGDGTSIELEARSAADTTTTASATPPEDSPGGSVGIGASVATTIVWHETVAAVEDEVTLTGAHDLTLTADTTDAIETTAVGGSAGGVAVTPVVAVTVATVKTTAEVGAAPAEADDPLTLSGDLTMTADQTASVHTDATGQASGDTAAVGAALALNVVRHLVIVTVGRDLDVAGSVTLSASGTHSSTGNAVAAASGAGGEGDNNDGGLNVDGLVGQQRDRATEKSAANGDDEPAVDGTPPAETSDGSIAIAAAIAVNILKSVVSATIADGVTVVAGDEVSLSATASTDASATADGSAADGGTAGIGAAVAINLANVRNEASLGVGVLVLAGGLTLNASGGSASGGTSAAHRFAATAKAGAGGGVSIAGAFALNIVQLVTEAFVHTNESRGPPDPAHSGMNVTLSAGSSSSSSARAVPTGNEDDTQVTADTVGVGASVAINIVNDTTKAGLEDGAQLHGVDSLTIDAESSHEMTTEARAGVTAGDVGIAPVIAVAVSNVTSSAVLGVLAGGSDLGSLSASASLDATVTTTAVGDVASDLAIGAAIPITVVEHEVLATTLRDLDVAGNVSFSASGSTSVTTEAVASAGGAPGEDEPEEPEGEDPEDPAEPSKTVDDQVQDQLDLTGTLSGGASKTEGKKAPSAEGAGEQEEGDGTSETGESSQTKVSVAAAVAVNIVLVTVRAAIPAGVTVKAGGTVTVGSEADVDASVTADGTAANDPESTSVGVAVALNLAFVTNEALVAGHVTAGAGPTNGIVVTATMKDGGTHTFVATATSGASGGEISVAGSLTVSIVRVQTRALLDSGSTTGANGGDVTLTAQSSVASTADALPAEDGVSGSKVGVGASISVHIVNGATIAGVADTAVLTGARDLTITATGLRTLVTTAKTGAKGGTAVAPAIAVTVSNMDVDASVGTLTGATLTLTGKLVATATQTTTLATAARGDTEGTDTAVGVALIVNVVLHDVTSTTKRNITAVGEVSFAAIGANTVAANAQASAAGAPPEDSDEAPSPDAPSKGVDGQVAGNRDLADKKAGDAGTQGSDQANNPSPKAESSDGGVSVAGAVVVNVVITRSIASLGDGVTVTSTGGPVKLLASANTDAAALTDGTATGESATGVGVAVSLNVVLITNRATTGTATVNAQGLLVQALMTETDHDQIWRWNGTEWEPIPQVEELPQPKVLRYDGTAETWNPVDVPSGATFPDSPTEGDAFQLTASHEGKQPGYYRRTETDWVKIDEGTKVPTAILGLVLGPEDGDLFRVLPKLDTRYELRTDIATSTPDIHRWNGTAWVHENSSPVSRGVSFPATPSTGALFRLAEHDVRAEAKAGAGATKTGVAGALALNVVTNKTEAIAPAGATIAAGTGDVTFEARTNRFDSAKALADAKAGKVGVGASIAINVLVPNHTTASIADGVTLSGGGDITLRVNLRQMVTTKTTGGAAGGTAVAPAVAVAIVVNETTARVGTGTDLTMAGILTIDANQTLTVVTEGDADAAGDKVAVGATIAVNVVVDDTLAELFRSAPDAAGAAITARSDVRSSLELRASAKGGAPGSDEEGDDADKQANDQLNNNDATKDKTPDLNEKSGGEAGTFKQGQPLPSSSDKVDSGNSAADDQAGTGDTGTKLGVAAAVGVNVLISINRALVADGLIVGAQVPTSSVAIVATRQTDASAKAIATSVTFDGAAISAAVGVNVAVVTNEAKVGTGVTCEAPASPSPP